jgi:hypothetical protein
VICSQHFFFGRDLLFFRPPSDPLQIRFLGLEIRVRFSDSPTPEACHQDFSFTADPLSRFRFGAAYLFRCSSRAPGIRVPASVRGQVRCFPCLWRRPPLVTSIKLVPRQGGAFDRFFILERAQEAMPATDFRQRVLPTSIFT